MSLRRTGEPSSTRLRVGFVALAAGLQLLTASCASPSRMLAVPGAQTAEAQTAIPNARYFPDRDPDAQSG